MNPNLAQTAPLINDNSHVESNTNTDNTENSFYPSYVQTNNNTNRKTSTSSINIIQNKNNDNNNIGNTKSNNFMYF